MKLAPLAAALLALAAGCSDGHAAPAPPPRETAGARPGGPVPPVPPSKSPLPRPPTAEQLARYPWLDGATPIRQLDAAIPAPPGFTRVALAAGSFGAFLRSLPLLPAGVGVHAYDGREILAGSDPRLAAVIALDAGQRDLQQCADTAIRLHAEWLWSRSREAEIGYHFTSGDLSTWSAYAAGDRPVVDARSVKWVRSARPSSGHGAFRAYLDQVFTYAGTVSLAREAAPIARKDARVSDAFVLPGGPGHTVLILDLAVDERGRRRALLGQGFMPAQQAHVLAAGPGEPWFDLDAEQIDTPFWPAPFPWSSLRRMKTARGDTD